MEPEPDVVQGLDPTPTRLEDPPGLDAAIEAARKFHEAYERLAPSFGYATREASAKPWDEVPENNRRLMTAVCAELLPALRAGALRDAADDIGQLPPRGFGAVIAADWLRERADREVAS